MAANRATSRSTTPGVLSGNSYLDDVSDEIVALWDRAPNVLAITGGTANAITATITPALTTGFGNGMLFTLVPTADNIAGGVTVTVGATTLDIVDRDGNALGAGELKTGRKVLLTFNATSGDLHLIGPTTPAFTKEFVSAQQTITAAGLLTLAHGLGGAPKLVQVAVVNQTAELGYAIGDVLIIAGGAADHIGNSNAYGVAVVPDSTNVVVKFGANNFAAGLINKSTGALTGPTAANWKLVVRAWA